MKNDLIYIAIIIVKSIFNAIPRRLALKFGTFAGGVWYLLGTKDRNRAVKQIMSALKYSENKAGALARACFEEMGRNLCDVVRMGKWSKEFMERIVRVEGLEHFEKEYARGKGVLALTGHIGNFELLAAWFSYCKGVKVSVIGRQLYDKRLDRMLVDQRRRFHLENIPTTASPLSLVKTFRDGRALGVLLDQDSSKISGYFVDFFGKKANTAAGPVFIALKTGAPIVPMAIYREGETRYVIRVLPPLEIGWTNDRRSDMLMALGQCNRALEELIMWDPSQWVWIHDRWRNRPPGEK